MSRKLHIPGDILRIGIRSCDLMIVEKVIIDSKAINRTRRHKYIGHHFMGNIVARYHCEVKRASVQDCVRWEGEREHAEY